MVTATIVARHPNVQVVGEAATLREAGLVVAGTLPELLVVDLDIPDPVSALERLVAKAGPDASILGFDAPRAPHASASARLLGGMPRATVVHHDAGQEAFLGALSALLAESAPLVVGAQRAGAPLLTARQTETLALAADGMSNAQIAERLYISVGTVKRHLSDAFIALGARSRVEAINRARSAGHLDEAAAAALTFTRARSA
ncbi:response regulator transcription factor [Microterricola viridarii]|uniref:HTH luxR-type domain-containing protein n=1 Tax=Microterricola viridarii TaxID=412690 RepID=A0A0X8E2F5_9MICO|nr:response regulator transcription factor [Microterricola viridarii]AMB58462.1 hypothetical protein AWU67_05885 [Microterricola viridarii]